MAAKTQPPTPDLVWFDLGRVPADRPWPFLISTRHVLVEIRRDLEAEIDLTEGSESILITGCIRAYRQAVFRRILDLAQSTIILWNKGFLVGAVVSSRALLETLGMLHSFLRRAEKFATEKKWEAVGQLVDAYAFARSDIPDQPRPPESPPWSLTKIVEAFLAETQPGHEAFWRQICDAAHPNGFRIMTLAGTLGEKRYRMKASHESELAEFAAVYNCLYSCCWLVAANEDFEILLEVIRSGDQLPADHPLLEAKRRMDEFVASVCNKT